MKIGNKVRVSYDYDYPAWAGKEGVITGIDDPKGPTFSVEFCDKSCEPWFYEDELELLEDKE